MADLIIRERAERSLRDVSYVLFRHKRKVTWFFFGVIALVTIVTFLLPETYQSEAKVLVRLGREIATLDPTATTTGQVVQVGQRRESEVKSELEILRSRDLAEKVVDAIGPEAFLWSFIKGSDPLKNRDEAVRSFMKSLDISAERDSNIINISYEAKDPKLAHAVVGKLMDNYLVKHLAVYHTPGSDKFFARQADQLRTQLAQTEEDLRDLKNKTGIASVNEQRSLLLNQIAALQKGAEETEAALSASRSKVQWMEKTLGSLPTNLIRQKLLSYPGNPVDYLQQRLHDLRLKEQDLLTKYTEKNHLVKEMRRQIGEIEALLNREGATHRQVTQLALLIEKATIAELQARAGAIKQELTVAQNNLKGLNDAEVLMAQKQREIDLLATNYRNYSEKLEQVRIDHALNLEKISNISVVQAATYPVKPVRPHKPLNLALGLFLGTFGAIALAFAAEYTDHSFKRPEDVEKKLHTPVLATIPLLAENGMAKDRRNLPLLVPETRISCGVLGEAGECYEALCDRLLRAEAPPRLIGVTSCRSGEGVSSVAANIAKTLARKGNERVLFVEANLMRPSAHQAFGVESTPGLTDIVLEGEGNITSIKNAHTRNLDVIPSGQGGISLSQLAESKEFADLLSLWRNEYSFVVFDLPAIFKGTSTLRLASLVEGVVLVVGAEGVSSEVAQRAMAELARARVNVLGVVLNKRCFHIPDWLYHKL
jgi:capsular exopolysaccharide synthesis family protein